MYNEAEHLRDVLQQLDTAPWPCAVEYVVVDNCRTDGSLDVIEAYQYDHASAAVWCILKFNLRGQDDPAIQGVPAKYRNATRARL